MGHILHTNLYIHGSMVVFIYTWKYNYNNAYF